MTIECRLVLLEQEHQRVAATAARRQADEQARLYTMTAEELREQVRLLLEAPTPDDADIGLGVTMAELRDAAKRILAI